MAIDANEPVPQDAAQINASQHDASFALIEEPRRWGLTMPQWVLITIIVVFTAGALLYRGLFAHNLGHSAALFIGLPSMCAVLLAMSPAAKTATGAIVKGITLVVLVLAPLLGEGWLCILIASPLFYLVGVLIGVGLDYSRKRQSTTLRCATLLAIIPLSLEGVSPRWTVDRTGGVEVRRVVNAPARQVAATLAGGMNVRVPRPFLLRFGFPAPLRSWGYGLSVGSEHGIHFAGAEAVPGYVRLQAVNDGSKLLQWTRWRTSEVSWTALDATHTMVVSRITYDRQLDPAWYFGPLERAAVRGAADYLIRSNATPVNAR